MKPRTGRIGLTLAVALVAVAAMSGREVSAQSNPYRAWRELGQASRGKNVRKRDRRRCAPQRQCLGFRAMRRGQRASDRSWRPF